MADGDYREAVLGAVNYGRDSDSIATMAGAITGALGGAERCLSDWLERRRRRRAGSTSSLQRRRLVDVAVDIWASDAERDVRRRRLPAA